MITLEAFINKNNIKKMSNNDTDLDYSDINFLEPKQNDCYKWFERLDDNSLLPRIEYLDRRRVRGWSVKSYPYNDSLYKYFSTLVVQLDPSPDSDTVFEPVLLFAINKDINTNLLWFCKRGSFSLNARDRDKYEDLYKQCEAIAASMGFNYWNDKRNVWSKTEL